MAKKKNRKLAKFSGAEASALIQEVRELIESGRERVAAAINRGMAILYWQIGTRIRREVLQEKRAEYGKEILQTLSAKLVEDYGKGFSERNLAYMVRFAEVFPDPEIVQTLSAN